MLFWFEIILSLYVVEDATNCCAFLTKDGLCVKIMHNVLPVMNTVVTSCDDAHAMARMFLQWRPVKEGIVGCRRRGCLRVARVPGYRRRQRLQSTTGVSALRRCRRQSTSSLCCSSVTIFVVMVMVFVTCMCCIRESSVFALLRVSDIIGAGSKNVIVLRACDEDGRLRRPH